MGKLLLNSFSSSLSMKKITYSLVVSKLFFACFGIFFATVILLTSLFMAHSVQSSEGMPASSRAMYFKGVVLPDHSAYPVIAGMDRVLLWTAEADKKDEIKLEYAERRLKYAAELLRKRQVELAASTITKSQKYVLEVAHSFLNGESSLSQQTVIKHMESHISSLELIRSFFGLSNESSITILIEEEQAVLMSVKAKK